MRHIGRDQGYAHVGEGGVASPGPIGWLVIVSLAVVATPLLQAHLPPLIDYPNHLARMWLLAGGASEPPTSQIYRVDWSSAGTNIGLDLLASVLGRIMPVALLVLILVALALVLPPLGAVLLNRAVFGGFHWWQIAFALLAFSQTMLAGFLNFQLSLGIALLAASVDQRLQRRGAVAAALGRSVFSFVLLVTHAFGLFFYAALLGGLAIGPSLRALTVRRDLASAFRRAVLSLLPLCLVLLVFIVAAPKLPGAHVGPGGFIASWPDESLLRRLNHLASPLTSYSWKVDAVFAIAFVLPAAVALVQRHVHAGLLLVAGLLAVCGMLAPEMLAGTHWIERRFPIMAALAAASSLRPELPRRYANAAAAALMVAVLARSTWIGWIWADREADVAAVEVALAKAPEGSAILLMEHRPSLAERDRAPLGRYAGRSQPTYWHLGTLAVPMRKSFVPTLFTAAGKQPIQVMPPWSEIAVPEGAIPSVDQIVDTRPESIQAWPYVKLWKERFDFILVVNADLPNEGGAMPDLPELTLVSDQGFARLYQIARKPAAG